MLFVIICTDNPDRGDLRADNREIHLDYLESKGDQLRLGGRTTTSDGESATGSILVVDVESLAEAEAFANNDPFAKAGMFKSVEIRPWACSVGAGLEPG
tara:strand:+ start:811 stop:1107 length:297 start_codon:yes stop_codon:yes gene_type:complete